MIKRIILSRKASLYVYLLILSGALVSLNCGESTVPVTTFPGEKLLDSSKNQDTEETSETTKPVDDDKETKTEEPEAQEPVTGSPQKDPNKPQSDTTGNIGSVCTEAVRDCTGSADREVNRSCLKMFTKEGFCTRICDSFTYKCLKGYYCAEVPETTKLSGFHCWPECKRKEDGTSNCREGYVCEKIKNKNGWACLPDPKNR